MVRGRVPSMFAWGLLSSTAAERMGRWVSIEKVLEVSPQATLLSFSRITRQRGLTPSNDLSGQLGPTSVRQVESCSRRTLSTASTLALIK